LNDHWSGSRGAQASAEVCSPFVAPRARGRTPPGSPGASPLTSPALSGPLGLPGDRRVADRRTVPPPPGRQPNTPARQTDSALLQRRALAATFSRVADQGPAARRPARSGLTSTGVRDAPHQGQRDGAVKLLGVERDEGVAGYRVVLIGVVSASRGKADYIIPGGEAGGHLIAILLGGESVAAGTEVW
jgi:hypothetical protein